MPSTARHVAIKCAWPVIDLPDSIAQAQLCWHGCFLVCSTRVTAEPLLCPCCCLVCLLLVITAAWWCTRTWRTWHSSPRPRLGPWRVSGGSCSAAEARQLYIWSIKASAVVQCSGCNFTQLILRHDMSRAVHQLPADAAATPAICSKLRVQKPTCVSLFHHCAELLTDNNMP